MCCRMKYTNSVSAPTATATKRTTREFPFQAKQRGRELACTVRIPQLRILAIDSVVRFEGRTKPVGGYF